MTAAQIASKLNGKGFIVTEISEFVVASLNRKVSAMEIEVALDFEIARHHIQQNGDSVVIVGQE